MEGAETNTDTRNSQNMDSNNTGHTHGKITRETDNPLKNYKDQHSENQDISVRPNCDTSTMIKGIELEGSDMLYISDSKAKDLKMVTTRVDTITINASNNSIPYSLDTSVSCENAEGPAREVCQSDISLTVNEPKPQERSSHKHVQESQT